MTRAWTALLMGLLTLSGCTTAPRDPSRASPLPPRPLASPSGAGEHVVSQVVRGGVAGREMTLSCAISIENGVMSVVGLNATGIRLFTISHDGKAVRVDKAFAIPEAIPPERLLADLQLVYWPLQPLQEALRPAGYEVSEPSAGTRRLRHGDRLVAEVHYADADAWSGRAWLVSFEFGFSLQIDSQPL